jgi:carbon-monoxide dehydrogenase small subunit
LRRVVRRVGTDVMDKRNIEFVLNGSAVSAWMSPHQTLLEVLRDEVGATEVKYGCGEGVCGTCTVMLDGDLVNACLLLGVQAAGHEIVTVRGLQENGELHPLQSAFLEMGAAQCGFCTPGMLLTARRFLEENPAPSRDEIRRALAGNLCRCTGYHKIVDAIEACAASGGQGVFARRVSDLESNGGAR